MEGIWGMDLVVMQKMCTFALEEILRYEEGRIIHCGALL